jgi:hypothetical protein
MATELATRQDSLPVEAATSILSVIERAARSPDVDLDKMERLLAMQERIVEREAKAAYAASLARMQPELPIIGERGGIKDKNGRVQSTYALWEDVVGLITPVLSRHDFSLSFRTSSDATSVTVTGVLAHAMGHSEQTSLTLPFDASGSKNAVQSVGSSTSYGKRYTASALLNLRTGVAEDDDGQTGGAHRPAEPEGYENWRMDMEAVAGEGRESLKAAWAKSPPTFRTYATSADAAWWDATKRSAK